MRGWIFSQSTDQLSKKGASRSPSRISRRANSYAPPPPQVPPKSVYEIDFLKKLALSALRAPPRELMGQRWFCPFPWARLAGHSCLTMAPLDLNGVNIEPGARDFQP